MSTPPKDPGSLADAPAANWVDLYAPDAIRPYCRLARYDRPIGSWLLLLPCWFGLAFAHLWQGDRLPNFWFMALFALGAVVMRGAGCTWNDIVDRDFDGRVARTQLRPIPAGEVTVRQALMFAVAQALVGLVVLVQFNALTISLAIASLLLVAAYPFAKRFTYWPQVVLGMTFNWGALVAFTAVCDTLPVAALVLYAGAIAWTIGYDTIYAHQDSADDALLGLKSTALRFGDATPRWLTLFYGLALGLIVAAAALSGARSITYLGVGLIGLHFGWQIWTLDTGDARNCLTRFKSNREVGLILTGAVLADMALS